MMYMHLQAMIFNDFVAIYVRIWITWMKLKLMCDINYMDVTWKYRWTCKHNKHIYRVKERKSCGWWLMKYYLMVVSNWPPHRCNKRYSWNFGDTIAIGSMAEFMLILITWMKVLKYGWNCKRNKYMGVEDRHLLNLDDNNCNWVHEWN